MSNRKKIEWLQAKGYRVLILLRGGVEVWKKAKPGKAWHFGSMNQAVWAISRLSAPRKALRGPGTARGKG